MRKLLLASVLLLGVFPVAAMAGHDDCGGSSGYRGGYSNYDYEARAPVIYDAPRHYPRPVIVIQAHRARYHGHHFVQPQSYDHHRGGHRGYHHGRHGHHGHH